MLNILKSKGTSSPLLRNGLQKHFAPIVAGKSVIIAIIIYSNSLGLPCLLLFQPLCLICICSVRIELWTSKQLWRNLHNFILTCQINLGKLNKQFYMILLYDYLWKVSSIWFYIIILYIINNVRIHPVNVWWE